MLSDDAVVMAAATMFAGDKTLDFDQCIKTILDACGRMMPLEGPAKCSPDAILLAAAIMKALDKGHLDLDDCMQEAVKLASWIQGVLDEEESAK